MDRELTQYFEEHAVDGALPTEAMEKLTLAAMNGMSGDDAANTGDNNSGDAPEPARQDEATTTEETREEAPPREEKEQAEQAEQAEPEPERPVIMARDGKNTIPYSELVDAREEAKNERSQREALQREMDAMKARREDETATAEKTETPAEDPLADLREDWPEFVAAMEKMTAEQRRIIAEQQRQIQTLAEHQARIHEAEMIRAQEKHYRDIAQVHPDAQAIFASEDFAEWYRRQPGFSRSAIDWVLQQGNAEQVAEVFSAFKAQTPGWSKTQQDNQDNRDNGAAREQARQTAVKTAREQAGKQAKTATPKSLSDIPGGEATPTDPVEAFMQKNPEDRMAAMMSMTPEQINEIRRRAT